MSDPTPVLPAAEAEKIEKVAETVEQNAEVVAETEVVEENSEEIIEKVKCDKKQCLQIFRAKL